MLVMNLVLSYSEMKLKYGEVIAQQLLIEGVRSYHVTETIALCEAIYKQIETFGDELPVFMTEPMTIAIMAAHK